MSKRELGDVLSGVAAFHRLRMKAHQQPLSMSEGRMLMRILECFEPVRVTESGVGREHTWLAFEAPASVHDEDGARAGRLQALSLYRARIAAAQRPSLGERIELRLGSAPGEWRFDGDVVDEQPQQGTVTVALRSFIGRGASAALPPALVCAA